MDSLMRRVSLSSDRQGQQEDRKKKMSDGAKFTSHQQPAGIRRRKMFQQSKAGEQVFFLW